MGSALTRRLASLEGSRGLLAIGDLLDHLDGAALPKGKSLDPAMLAAFDEMGSVKEVAV